MSFLINPFVFGAGAPPVTLDYFAGDLTTQPWTSSATWPNAIYSSGNNKTYLSWLAEGGPQVARIMAYDHATETWGDPVTIGTGTMFDDTHGTPAICELSDGRVVAFWDSHIDTGSRVAVSAANDITTWTEQARVGTDVTYPKPVNVPDGSGGGTLYLFYRHDRFTFSVQAATYTSGGAISFGSRIDLISFSANTFRIYASEVRLKADESAIETFFCETALSDGGDRRHLSYVAYELTGANAGGIRNIDGTHTVASGSLPLTDRTVYAANYIEVSTGNDESEIPSWCYDTSGDKHVIYFDGSSDAGVTYDLYHDRYVDGVGWDGPTLVTSLEPRGLPVIRYISLVPAASGAVEAWYPKGETGGWSTVGADDMVRRVRASGGTWGSEETILAGGGVHALAHPSSVFNAHADLRVVFCERAQTENFNDRGLFKRYAYGDGGFVQFPELNDPLWPYVVEQVVYEGADSSTPTDLDQSWAKQLTTFANGAVITSNRGVFDGTNNLVQMGIAGAQYQRRYHFDNGNFDAAFAQGGAFCIEVFGVKFNSLVANQTLWARSGLAGNRGPIIAYLGSLSQFRVYLSSNGTSVSDLRFAWTPADTSTEYDFRITRDSGGTIRLHIGVSGGTLSFIGSDTFGTGGLSGSNVQARHGTYGANTDYLNGTIRATRLTAHDRGTTDADVPAISFPLSTN